MHSDSGLKAVIFDLGNVLVDFDHTIAAKRISQFSDKTPQEIFDLFFDSGLTGLFEEGKIAPQRFFLGIKDALHLKLEYEDFLSIWNEIFFLTEKNLFVYKIAKALKDNLKIALLTNINALHFDYLKKNYPVFDVFHHIVTSFEVGARKPHPLIYNKVLELLKVEPKNAFYTDDRSDLIEKANSLGIKGFVFTGVEKLRRDLLSNGISVS
jgi:HAD superfamily hydrolase (TIGR01549 family)